MDQQSSAPKKKTKARASAFDVRLGRRLREVRVLRQVTQEQLAGAVGVTFQQIQKYENGQNRMAAERVMQCARYLDVSPYYLMVDDPQKIVPISDPFITLQALAVELVDEAAGELEQLARQLTETARKVDVARLEAENAERALRAYFGYGHKSDPAKRNL